MVRYNDSDDDYPRSRSRPRARDHSPDYYSGGAAYDPPFAPPRDSGLSLQVPAPRYRPRSVPPVSTDVVRRNRSRSRSRSRSSSRSSSGSRNRANTPLNKARHAVKENFTNTPTGLGVGLLGAIVGGLALREATDVASRRHNARLNENDPRHRPRGSKDHDKSKMISTLVGAVVGGLGANALEKKFEEARHRDDERQKSWERKFGKESDLPHYDTGDWREQDHGRGRSRGRAYDDDDDYVYDDSRRGARRNKSEDNYRYRN